MISLDPQFSVQDGISPFIRGTIRRIIDVKEYIIFS